MFALRRLWLVCGSSSCPTTVEAGRKWVICGWEWFFTLNGVEHKLFTHVRWPDSSCTELRNSHDLKIIALSFRWCFAKATAWHQSSGLSSAGTAPALSCLCSAAAALLSLPPTISIRPCPVIYNSSGILPPSTLLHQDSINILFGPPATLQPHAYVVYVWATNSGLVGKAQFGILAAFLFWHLSVLLSLR